MLNNNLEKMDFACKETMKKGEDYSKQTQIYLALRNYMSSGDLRGFTRNAGAREYIKSLSIDDIRKELLKNIVKKQSCSFYYGYNVRLGTEKTFDDNLEVDECEALMVNSIKDMDMNDVDYLLDKKESPTDKGVDVFEKLIEFKNTLTDREAQVFELRMNGFSYNEISILLDIKSKNIYSYIKQIRRKVKKSPIVDCFF